MTKLRTDYSKIIREITEIERSTNMNENDQLNLVKLREEEKKLTQQINEESFGLEHIFRELSLIWTFNA
jgi:phosphoglycerate-specific signal transduction histidine kinase